MTDTIRLSILDWDDVIDRTALGFDQLKPPGLAEIVALSPQGAPIAAADAAANRSRRVELACGQGPVVAVSGRFAQTSVTTTVAALLESRPIPARPCDPAPLQLRVGTQELLISPGAAFIVDGIELNGPLARQLSSAQTVTADIRSWRPDRREISVTRSPAARVLVVPESVNPGWVAHTSDDAALTPLVVNGWQQGWVVPAGQQGTITLSFGSNATYRAGLLTGLALLPVLLLLALLPARRPVSPGPATRPWTPGLAAAAGVLAAGVMLGGAAGAVVFGAALAVGYQLRDRTRLRDRIILAAAPAGLILAGALLARYPWRSVDGYIGFSPWVQLPALVAVGALAASAITPRPQPLLRRVGT